MVANSEVVSDEPTCGVEENVVKGKTKPNDYTNYSNVGELLLERMRSVPNDIAQVDAITDVENTFADLSDRIIKCALWLKKQGVRPGEVVAVSTHNHLNTIVPCLAATCIGAIFNPWDSELNIQLARHFASLSQPKVIFINESMARIAQDAFKIEGLKTKVVIFDENGSGTTLSDILKGHTAKEVESFQCEKLHDRNATMVILYSSGTTGLPKGVQLSHNGVFNQLSAAGVWNLESETPLWFSNMYWISGTLLSMNCILARTKRIIFPYFDEKRVCEVIQKYKVTWLFLSTSMTNRWIKSGYLNHCDLPSLKCILTGGAVLKREMQEQMRESLPTVNVVQGYGMTEIGGVATCQVADTPSGSCGVAALNVQLKIIDPETGKTLGANETGEVLVKAATMSTGYYKNPEATRNTFDKDGWVHTGDLAYYNEKGELYIIDRLKELIKYRGRHVSPGVVENLLHTHPAVVEAAVVGLPHPTDDEHPIAFVRLVPDSNVNAQELMDIVDKNVMDHERLRGGIRFIEKFPETATGKIARKEVKAMARALAARN